LLHQYLFINLFRAGASLWVLMGHCMSWGGWRGIPLPSEKMAVDLFMIISGFLMAANSQARSSRESLDSARNCSRFWLRRVFRIAPAYYVALAVAFISAPAFVAGYQELQKLPGDSPAFDIAEFTDFSATNFLLHLSFLFGLAPQACSSTLLPDWSLSLEMQFYLAFPLIFIVMERFGFARVALLLAIPSYLVGNAIFRSMDFREFSFLPMKLNYFLAGILLFKCLYSESNQWKRALTCACAFMLVALGYRYSDQWVVLPGLLAAMMLLGFLEGTGRTPRWVAKAIDSIGVKFASDTSYSVYLFHGFFISASGLLIAAWPALFWQEPLTRTVAILAFTTIGAYAVSVLTYRYIEKPGISAGKALLKRMPPNS